MPVILAINDNKKCESEAYDIKKVFFPKMSLVSEPREPCKPSDTNYWKAGKDIYAN